LHAGSSISIEKDAFNVKDGNLIFQGMNCEPNLKSQEKLKQMQGCVSERTATIENIVSFHLRQKAF